MRSRSVPHLLSSRHAAVVLALLSVPACTDGALAPEPVRAVAAVQSASVTQMIVVLRAGAEASHVSDRHRVRAKHRFEKVFKGFVATLTDDERAALLRDGDVLQIVPDERLETTESVQQGATWGLDRLDQRARPLDTAYHFGYTGAGVTAYVFDTGIRFDHVEFEGRAVRGFDGIGDGQNGADCHGHGTHVAGTIGGRAYGVAKGVRIVSVRVMDCMGAGNTSAVLAGIDWVMKTRQGPAIANLSIGGTFNAMLNDAVRKLVASRVSVTVSAGNNSGDACERSPASSSEAITVGAVNDRDTRRLSSNWGPCVDVFAPGDAIVSAASSSATGTFLRSGTSMAAPHVAGVLALWLQESPSLTPAQLQQQLVANATQNIVQDAKSANAHLLHSLRGSVPVPTPSEPAPAPAPEPVPAPTPEPAPQPAPAPEPTPTPATAPATPADPALKLAAVNRVDVRWGDRSSDESGFEIERREGSSAWVVLARVGANVTAYSDLTVARERTYAYRVRAFNAVGASGTTKEPSITITCRTKGKSTNCQ